MLLLFVLLRDGFPLRVDDPVKQAWIDQQVPQCGTWQPGMIMATKSLLANHPNPSDQDIDAAIPNLCRCGI